MTGKKKKRERDHVAPKRRSQDTKKLLAEHKMYVNETHVNLYMEIFRREVSQEKDVILFVCLFVSLFLSQLVFVY